MKRLITLRKLMEAVADDELDADSTLVDVDSMARVEDDLGFDREEDISDENGIAGDMDEE